MNRKMLARFIEDELNDYRGARVDGRYAYAWTALERAHILSQPDPWLHTKVHLEMMGFGLWTGDWKEIAGQIVRTAVAAIGTALGRAPAGNTGRASVPLLKVMPVPSDIADKLEQARKAS